LDPGPLAELFDRISERQNEFIKHLMEEAKKPPEPEIPEPEPAPVVPAPKPKAPEPEPEPEVPEQEPEPEVPEQAPEPEIPEPELEPEVPEAKTGLSDDDIFEQLMERDKENEEKPPPPPPKSAPIEFAKAKEPDDDNFDLLQNMLKEESSADKMSDEEIYEKLLQNNEKEKETLEDRLEVIGERKDEQFGFMNNELSNMSKEDEAFYKNLLSGKKYKKELPILKVSYDFKNLSEASNLSRETNMVGHSLNKYKPMLQKASELIKRRKVRDAINYYQVVMDQNIPHEFKIMIRRNINDLHEYLERYMSGD
jgi:hypothetical protein